MSVRAIIAVHVYGRRCNMDLIHAYAKAHNLFVIEDLAEAHGIKPHPQTDVACHSFYRNKVIAGEEGGAVWFREPERAKLARLLRCQGFTAAHDFTHVPRGHNYRLANLLAHPIRTSLQRYKENVAWRRGAEWIYDKHCPAEWRMPPRAVPWVYDLRIPSMTWAQQDEAVASLRAKGMEARHGFKPCSMQMEFAWEHGERSEGSLARRIFTEVIYLPLRPDLTEEEARLAFEVIRDVVG